MAEALRSMTGAGRASRDAPAGRVEVEARSVNHRFLKTSIRTQGPLPGLDRPIEDAVRERSERGHVSVFVRLSPASGPIGLQLDAQRFASAAERLTRLAAVNGLEPPTVSDVLRVPGVLGEPDVADDEAAVVDAVIATVGAALDQLRASREHEGEALRQELLALIAQIDELRERCAALSEQVPARAAQRLRARLEVLLANSGVEPDAAQLARECALLADRSDVREEIARLGAHCGHAGELLRQGGPTGRRLDFLAQELAREANTLATKASELDLGRLALDIKTLVERLREQVQNVE